MIATPEDISIMDEWWIRRGSIMVDRYLPSLAFCVWEDDVMKAGAFLCEMELNGGKGGLISWTIVNPDFMSSALRVVNKLLKEIEDYAVDNNFIALIGTTTSRLLERTYLTNGFELGDTNTNQYIITFNGTRSS